MGCGAPGKTDRFLEIDLATEGQGHPQENGGVLDEETGRVVVTTTEKGYAD